MQITMPPMPEVGHPEAYYIEKLHDAHRSHDSLLHESLKVAQYVTLALDHNLNWPDKLRYFEHAMHRHCTPPLTAADAVLKYYEQLKRLVMEHAGEEAIRVASQA